jgi:hypothetical protein
METLLIFLIILFFTLIPIGIVVSVAYFAAVSRKRKQDALMKTIPSNVDFSAIVRYNKEVYQNRIIKIKAFEGSGIIYLQNKIVHFLSTTGFHHQFDLAQTTIRWEGENLVNGLLKWFSMQDSQEKIYFNVESGMFIFHTDSKKMTTKQIYERIAMEQIDVK